LIITTNGFAQQLIDEDVEPARAQVLITKPLKNLHIKGTFHLDCGYYYFRNIDNRILLGGARNLDFKGENTTDFSETAQIQTALEALLKNTIIPDREFEIEHRWSGIMGVGSQKKPIVKQLSNNVYCGVRMGGMGIAIGSTIGKEVSELF
jgi:gamma-glutamylputrescine oxidase